MNEEELLMKCRNRYKFGEKGRKKNKIIFETFETRNRMRTATLLILFVTLWSVQFSCFFFWVGRGEADTDRSLFFSFLLSFFFFVSCNNKPVIYMHIYWVRSIDIGNFYLKLIFFFVFIFCCCCFHCELP